MYRQKWIQDFYTKLFHNKWNATKLIVLSFAAVIATGTLLLMLPFSTRDGHISAYDALFTATSATCVTGLVVHDTFSKFTGFGQAVILALIQVGGLGMITLVTMFQLAVGKRMGLQSMFLSSESANLHSVHDVRRLLPIIGRTTFTIEGIGFLLLATDFIPRYGPIGIWRAFFTAISAFCNAGFDVFGFIEPYTSLTTFADNPLVILTIASLIIMGGLGVIVWNELFFTPWKDKKFSFHTKVALSMTALLIVGGAIAIGLMEWHSPATMGPLPTWQKVMAAYFQSVTCRTAGFNSIEMLPLQQYTKVLMSILMFIGAAPGGTGGGIKNTTFAVILFAVYSVIRGKRDTVVFGRRIDQDTVNKSHTILFLAFTLVFVSTTIVYFTTPPSVVLNGINVLFEMTSAFATVGLSSGISGIMSNLGKVVTSLTMFAGRVGPLSLIVTLAFAGEHHPHQVYPGGKIAVG